MAGLQVFSRDLCPKKGRHISRADLFLSFFNFHGSLISVSLPLLIPASVLPDKPAVRCHAVREHDSLCSIGNLIERTRRRRTSGGRSPTTTAAERRHSNRSSPAGLEHRKKSHPSDDSFFYLFESTRRRRTSGGRSTATTAAERRHSNCSNPAGLEHTKKEVSNGYLLFLYH